jgi:hypothetical protein
MQPQSVLEIMAPKDKLTAIQSTLRDRYGEGLARYRAKRWDLARQAFATALEAVPDDGPTITFIKRLDEFTTNPPGEEWNGAWRLEQK